MVKIKLAVVRFNGELLKNGIYGSSLDAAQKARKAQDYANKKGIQGKVTCKFEEFDVIAINKGHVDLITWSERYEIQQRTNAHTQEKYWRIVQNCGLPLYSGLNDPTFTQSKAEQTFTQLLQNKVCQPQIKIHFIELADGTKLKDLC